MKRAHRAIAHEIADALKDPTRADWVPLAKRWLLVLAPPRKKRPREPAKAARRATVRELDALARAIVFARDEGKCQWTGCGRSDGLMDWAHILSRRHLATRWSTANSVVLCRAHHMLWHDRPLEAADWYIATFGMNSYQRLLAASKRRATDKGLVKLALMEEAKKLGVPLK